MSRATINRIAVFSILLVIVFVSARRIYLNSQDQLYTVGQINRIISPSKGGLSAIFSYEIDNQEYSGTVKIYKYEDVAVSGAKFIVSVPKGYMNRDAHLPTLVTGACLPSGKQYF